MIKTLTAYTAEVDDVNDAVDEILEQLDIDTALLKNSLGIVTCHLEFVEEGIFKALADALPFDVVGMTTLSSSVSKEFEMISLSIMVLTSDDVVFKAGVSAPVSEDTEGVSRNVYQSVTAGEAPVMMLAFVPMNTKLSGDDFLQFMDEASGGVPVFGSAAIDFNHWIRSPRVLFNGENYTENIVLMAMYGNVNASYSLTSISEKNVLKQKAVITDSEKNILKEVNGGNATEYLKGMGLIQDENVRGGQLVGVGTIPFMVYPYEGAKPVARNVFGITENGSIICGARMFKGATLGIGSISLEDVIETAKKAVMDVVSGGAKGVLMFSCASRSVALDLDAGAEAAVVEDTVDGKIPYLFAYSGGEICPVPNEKGGLTNAYHNSTLAILSFT